MSTDRNIDELTRIEAIRDILKDKPWARVKVEAMVTCEDAQLPVYSFAFGPKDPGAPTIAFVGGVHGLEVIGIQVVMSFLESMVCLCGWDELVHNLLAKTRVLFYPCVNPGGLYQRTRSNPRGVDLMRNAPVEGERISPFFLVAGQRISNRLAWYRGRKNAPMEVESAALDRFVRRELWPAKCSILVDVHSGFGAVDRLSFPSGC